MAQPPLSGTSEQVYTAVNELSRRCFSIVKDAKLFVDLLEQKDKENFSNTLGKLRAAIVKFGAGSVGALAGPLDALTENLIDLRCAIEDAPDNDRSRELCNRINQVKDDVRLFGDSLSVKFPPVETILSEDDRKKRELASAFSADVTCFKGPCVFLNEITKFLDDPDQLMKMKTKLAAPCEVIQLAESFPVPNNDGGCSVLYNHPNYKKLRAVRKNLQAIADKNCEESQTSVPFHKILITGDPGVGKSHYLIFDLLNTMIENVGVPNFKVVLILYDAAYAYSSSSRWFECRSIDDAKSAVRIVRARWDTYLFLDCCDFSNPTCRTISVSSPNRKHFEDFETSGALRRFLPAWTLDEVKEAFIKMRKLGVFKYAKDDPCPVTEDSISAEFELWGGIPRILYHMARGKYSPRRLMKALFGLNKETIEKINGRLERYDSATSKDDNQLREEDLPHILYHYDVNPITFECDYDYRPVNEVIAGYIDWVINRRTIEEYRSLIKRAPGGLPSRSQDFEYL